MRDAPRSCPWPTFLVLREAFGYLAGVRMDRAGRAVAALDGLVPTIHSVVDPDKLHRLGPVSDVARLPGK
ncbi:hypothetical protein [Streptosporangium saharense]|uniref:hypothetical protein n=1 Tax=Streptosporangium saharense TaxID=1706840 RepID=UPI00344502F1